jgi:hypothetical protein
LSAGPGDSRSRASISAAADRAATAKTAQKR